MQVDPANIAEGYAKRRSAKEFGSFLAHAMGSANELEVHFDIAHELDYISAEEHGHFVEECRIIGKQLYRLREYWLSLEPKRLSSN